MNKKLIILDRDGVINHDSPDFIKSPSEWIPINGSLEAIKKLNDNNYIVTVATNQSGLARGLFSDQDLVNMHDKMKSLLSKVGGKIDYVEYCPHLAEDNCTCRKPLPGMYQSISRKYSIPLDDVPVVGDSLRDLQAAVAVNASPYLVLTGKGNTTLQNSPLPNSTHVFESLHSMVNFLIEQ